MIEVRLYSRPECPLCEEVQRDLAELAAEFPHRVTDVNILNDPLLFERFRSLVPVVEMNGRALLYPPHDWLSLRNELAAARAEVAL